MKAAMKANGNVGVKYEEERKNEGRGRMREVMHSVRNESMREMMCQWKPFQLDCILHSITIVSTYILPGSFHGGFSCYIHGL
jgi:hypothetical protein